MGGGRNQGARVGDAEFVCFLDSDARLLPDTLARLVAPLVDDDTVGLAAPVFTAQAPEASAGRAPTFGRKVARALNRTDVYARTPGQGRDDVADVDFAIGACQVFRRRAFDAVDGLDDSAAFGPEDVDFCLRVRAAGYRIVQVADARCDHPPRRAFKGLATTRGMRHGWAVARHLWRHKRSSSRGGGVSARLDVVVVAYGNADVIGDVVDARPRSAGCRRGRGRRPRRRRIGRRSRRRTVPGSSRIPNNPGFGAGQNHGVALTSAPYVLLLNPDADPDAAGIVAGIDALDRDPTVAVVQGVIANRATGAPERSQGRELGPVHLVGRACSARRLLTWRPVRGVVSRVGVVSDHVERVPDGPVFVESLAATCVLVRRSAFDDIGGFDESYFLYGEDLDLCRRLRRTGWHLLALPQGFAQHESGASSSNSTERELSWWRGTMRFAALWWSTAAWSLALAAPR